MGDPAVHWHEGMLLRPQHFQAADRYWHDRLGYASRWDRPFHWGLWSVRLDEDALGAGKFKVQRLEARMRDGTIVRVPDDAVVQNNDLDLKPALGRSAEVEVALAVPVLQVGGRNVQTGPGEVARYLVEHVRDGVPDENDPQLPKARDVRFRRPHVRLLVTGEDDSAGFETLALARVRRSGQVGAVPVLSAAYVPPLLACHAWRPLQEDVLDALAGQVAALVESYSKRVRGRPRFGSNNPDEVLTLEKFRILNETHTYFRVLVGARGLHPFDAYVEMCRLLGRLAILGKGLPTFDPPAYDHDDLGPCFTRVKQYIDELLTRDFDPGYQQREFVGRGLALFAGLEQPWLAKDWKMYLGVSSSLPSAECARYLQGVLNMKIAAYGRVEEVFKQRARGLVVQYVNNQPALLPSGQDMTYFEFVRESAPAEWNFVQSSLDLAVRLNEHLIEGGLQDKTEFSLKVDGKPVRMTFTLFVVPPSSSQSP